MITFQKHPLVEKVNHPAVTDDPEQQRLYKKYFPNGGGSIFTFEIKGDAKTAKKFIDNLELFSLLANVADVKSLVIHPASTTHSELNEAGASQIRESSLIQFVFQLVQKILMILLKTLTKHLRLFQNKILTGTFYRNN